MTKGIITVEELRALVASSEVDTVIVAVCDMQGRLVGKRVTGEHFVAHCLEHGTHLCTYLLATDMELTTPGGFASTSWEAGYGDYRARPDWTTARRVPWLERTALVLGDWVDEESGEEVAIAPRTILRRQIERAAALGFRPKMASELEFYLFRDTYEGAHAKGYVGLERSGWYSEDYSLFQATKAEPLYRAIRNLMTEAGVPVEFSKGEAAPGQHEVNIRYTDALGAADRHALLKHGAKEIAHGQGCALTFMAKPDEGWTGSSGHVHLSLWDPAGERNLFSDPDAALGMSETMRLFLGGLTACARELSLFVAPNVNSYKRYASASWAPVNIVWARDNRTCGLRVVGRGSAMRIEDRFPGGDVNPYLGYAAILAAGLHGIENRIEPPAEHRGNGYTATGVPRVPASLAVAITAWEASEVAPAAFGEDVVAHYLNAASVEQRAFDAAVTDWERVRYFERG